MDKRKKSAKDTKKPGRKDSKKKDDDMVRLNVDVPREQYQELRAKTFKERTSISEQIRTMIENYLSR